MQALSLLAALSSLASSGVLDRTNSLFSGSTPASHFTLLSGKDARSRDSTGFTASALGTQVQSDNMTGGSAPVQDHRTFTRMRPSPHVRGRTTSFPPNTSIDFTSRDAEGRLQKLTVLSGDDGALKIEPSSVQLSVLFSDMYSADREPSVTSEAVSRALSKSSSSEAPSGRFSNFFRRPHVSGSKSLGRDKVSFPLQSCVSN